MAITHATIQHRRGALKDFDATKMKPGEIAVTTDGSRKVLAAFAAGDVKELASKEDVENEITSGIESIKNAETEALNNIGTGVDSSLSQKGKAADAKETGDKIAELKDELDKVGNPTDEQISSAVNSYLDKNPVSALDASEAQENQVPTADGNGNWTWKSQLAGGNTGEEKDPTVPDWAKQEQKPDYTATEVGADPSGTAEAKVSAHNTSADAHNDIRLLVQGLVDRLNALADSDDTTLDQMSEIVAYIKNNKSLIDAVTTGKVSTTDIIDNLTTNVSNKPLSAAQGVALKALIDGIMGNIGTYVEDYLKENPITDSSVKEWAKKELGSGLIVSEDGRLSVDTVNTVEENNMKPITSDAVYAVLGNVEALLSML